MPLRRPAEWHYPLPYLLLFSGLAVPRAALRRAPAVNTLAAVRLWL
jgi:hypothetical protein